MNRHRNSTTFQERMEISARAAAGQTDAESAAALGCSRWTVRKWRRRGQRHGRDGLTSRVGRPAVGPLGTMATPVRAAIRQARIEHPGWGAATILATLRSDPIWAAGALPSRARIAAFLKHDGLTRRYQRHSALPQPPPEAPTTPHATWQLDAQGLTMVAGVGGVCLINGVDLVSRLKVQSYPSVGTTNPPREDYVLALRQAFLRYGLPAAISFDHGTVFYDNTTPSPFPTRLHLWLLALGIAVRFTRKRRPTDHAIIERTHQTMTKQALVGQRWDDQADLWAGLEQRRAVLNRQLPTRALHGQAPLQAYPAAVHSGRVYCPEWEEALLDLERVYAYLAHGRWFRQVKPNGRLKLGGYQYYLGRAWAGRMIEISFTPPTVSFLCQPEDSEASLCVPAQGLGKADLMGELDGLLRLPAYQLALPLSAPACRQQCYASALAGTPS